jgi:hypothetical protein
MNVGLGADIFYILGVFVTCLRGISEQHLSAIGHASYSKRELFQGSSDDLQSSFFKTGDAFQAG